MRSEHAAPVRRLERLSRLRDYEVDRHEPDPRGWTVVNRDGRSVGEVKDLIVDTTRMAATYLDVELDTKLFDLGDDDPHVLVPIERARADGRRLVVDEVDDRWVSELRSERERDREEFWDRMWHRGAAPAPAEARATRIRRRDDPRDDPDNLDRVISEVRAGEEVRIPVVTEEIVVERRPVEQAPAQPREVVNRATGEPPPRR